MDDLVLHLPLSEVVQDLHSTDPTQETCATVDLADYMAPTRQHYLDNADHTAISAVDDELWEYSIICPRCEIAHRCGCREG